MSYIVIYVQIGAKQMKHVAKNMYHLRYANYLHGVDSMFNLVLATLIMRDIL